MEANRKQASLDTQPLDCSESQTLVCRTLSHIIVDLSLLIYGIDKYTYIFFPLGNTCNLFSQILTVLLRACRSHEHAQLNLYFPKEEKHEYSLIAFEYQIK